MEFAQHCLAPALSKGESVKRRRKIALFSKFSPLERIIRSNFFLSEAHEGYAV